MRTIELSNLRLQRPGYADAANSIRSITLASDAPAAEPLSLRQLGRGSVKNSCR